MQYAARLLAQHGGEIRLIQGDEQGRPCWFYLQIEPDAFIAYKTAIRTGFARLAEYGEILASGWGTTPPDAIMMRMRAKHGFVSQAEPVKNNAS